MRKPVIRRLVLTSERPITGGRTLHTWNDLLGEFPGRVRREDRPHLEWPAGARWPQRAGNGVTIYATILGSPSRSVRNADLEELLGLGDVAVRRRPAGAGRPTSTDGLT